jgi:hypothetical protein
VPVHAYTTAVVSDDGLLQAEILSLPNFVRAEVAAPEEVVDELATWLNVDIQIVDDVTGESGLVCSLEWMAVRTNRVLGPREMPRLAEAVAFEPVVVIEQSPPVITNLVGLAAQVPAYTFLVENKPLLALGLEGALVVVWFAAGSVSGLRRAATEATYEVSKELLEKSFEGSWD